MSIFALNLIAAGALGVLGGPRAQPVRAQGWTSHGPVLPQVLQTSVAVDSQNPGTVYAAVFPPALFVSADDGATWTNISDSLLLDPITVHLSPDPSRAGVLYEWRGYCHGSVCYCCFAEIRRTLDGGEDWEYLPGVPGAVNAFAVDPRDTAVLYAGFMDYRGDPFSLSPVGFGMKSRDAGLTWESMSGLPTSLLSAIVPDPTGSSRVYAAGRGVFVSLDSGDTWAASNEGLADLEVHSLAVDALTGDVLYAGTASGVFRSVDAAVSWARTSLTTVAEALVVDPRSSGTVFAGTSEGVFRSSDGGKSWSPMNFGLTSLAVSSLAIDPSGSVLHAGTDAGVFDMPLRASTRALPQR